MRRFTQFAKSGAIALGGFTGRPAAFPKVHGSVYVGVGSEATGPTAKPILGMTVGFFGMSANRTFPTTVARVNRDQQDSGESGFVCKESSQLPEGPRMQNCSLRTPGLDSAADVGEVFNRQSSACAFSFGNNLLTDYVVGVASKALFFTGQFLQAARCRSGLDFLKPGSQFTMAEPDGLQLRTGVPLAIRIGSNVADSKVNAQEVGRLYRGCVGKIDSTVQVELPLTVNQIGLPPDSVKTLLLVLAINQRDDHTSFGKCPQADFIEPLEAKDSLVVGDGPVRFEDWAGILASMEALNRFANSPNGHLGGQAELVSNLAVRQFVDRRLGKHADIEPTPSRKGCGFVHALHCRQQPSRLFCIGQQPQLERQLHYNGVYHSLNWVASGNRRPMRSPRYPSAWLKPAVSRAF